MIARGLDLDDFLWALDHSRRRYLVRQARHTDLTHLADKCPLNQITIIRLHDGIDMVVVPCRRATIFDTWLNTDTYAELRLDEISCLRTFRRHDKR